MKRHLLLVGLVIASFGDASVARLAITPAVPDKARPLPLDAVRLTGGPLKHAQDLNAKYLLELQPDRMLAYFHERAGLPRKAEPYAGWDGDGRNLTGHIAGHYLSAVSLMYAATGDSRFKERADYVVAELKDVQDKHGDGYLVALKDGRQVFAEVAAGKIRSSGFDLNGQWAPWYTLHKLYAGLRDAFRHAGNRTALEIETRFAGWAERILSKLDGEQIQRMLNAEFGGMNEVLADLYADTGDKRWLVLSHKFEHTLILDPLKKGVDPLANVHGNTTIPKLIGSAARYAYAGDPGDGAAARFFWDRVVNHHSFVTGGHGKDEYFRQPGKLGAIVDGRTAESCNVYNMLKLTRRLFALEPRIEYAEFHERALFNHVLGSMDPADGSTCYMVPVGRAVQREYQDMQRSFTCCVGSGMESHALHGLGIYYESADRLWVNLFVPSTATWKAAGVRVAQETSFPLGEDATFTFVIDAPKAFTLALRRPSWAGPGFTVAVNGTSVKDATPPGRYVEVKRTWKSGDVVSVTIPKALHLQATPDNPRRAAVMWGPVVLAADLGPEIRRQRGAPPAARIDPPMLVVAERPVNEWLKPVPGHPGVFRTTGAGPDADLQLVPFYTLHRRTYGAHFDLFTPPEHEKRRGEIAAERERQRKLEAATVAVVQPGEMQPERDFNQQGEKTSVVRADGRPGRGGAGWFSFDMPVDPAHPLALVVTYHSDTRRVRSFDILVEGQKIASQRQDLGDESKFYDVEYPIPAELVHGKQKITVRFEARDSLEISPVFGLRIVRANAVR